LRNLRNILYGMLIRDEGYVKFHQERVETAPLQEALWAGLEAARGVLYRAGLVGMYADGIGFGNVSWLEPGVAKHAAFVPFIISGTQTGNRAQLDGRHYVRVVSVNALTNALRCEGPVDASSESMTHAAVYAGEQRRSAESGGQITCVLHVHHLEHWQRLLHRIPTTAAEVAYGTPAMAEEVGRLFQESDLASMGVFAMAGHEEGLVSFGATTQEALERLRTWGIL